MNDFRALFAFRLGLLSHSAQHGLGHIHLLHFYVDHLHAPGCGVLVKNALQAQVDLLAMREQFVEFLLTKDGPQSGLSELRSLVDVVRNFDDRFVRIDDAKEDDGVNFQGDVVAGDDVLRWYFERFLTEGDTDDAVDWREYEDEAGALRVAL